MSFFKKVVSTFKFGSMSEPNNLVYVAVALPTPTPTPANDEFLSWKPPSTIIWMNCGHPNL
jgi:hypothetical protein